MSKSRVEKSNFKVIEAELYCYHESKRYLEDLREEILEGSATQEVGMAVQSGTTGDTTMNKAIKLTSSREILECERRIRAIEKVLKMLEKDDKKLRLVQMKYFQRKYTDIGIAMELDISERTFYNWRKEAIRLIAEQLGWKI